uniref:Uncharacterized protein n=1 Tax=Babesia bovis TaxID=5865 RepID=S6BDX6_BABBO|nr:hypothetical protein [Babesia bovis]
MALYEGVNDTPIPDICMPKETKISESDMSTYITGYNDNVGNQLQFSSIANSLTQSRGTFPENISYKIEGNALTWIARGHQNNFTIQCTNALEIVDGFFRAEYFLDTSRILDNHGELQSLYHTEVPSISLNRDNVPQI